MKRLNHIKWSPLVSERQVLDLFPPEGTYQDQTTGVPGRLLMPGARSISPEGYLSRTNPYVQCLFEKGKVDLEKGKTCFAEI